MAVSKIPSVHLFLSSSSNDMEMCSLKVLELEGSPSRMLLRLMGERGCTTGHLMDYLVTLGNTEAVQCLKTSGTVEQAPQSLISYKYVYVCSLYLIFSSKENLWLSSSGNWNTMYCTEINSSFIQLLRQIDSSGWSLKAECCDLNFWYSLLVSIFEKLKCVQQLVFHFNICNVIWDPWNIYFWNSTRLSQIFQCNKFGAIVISILSTQKWLDFRISFSVADII